ncbi:hypothetical protein SBRCBS47491_009349 [Sporothrix bragantina]|uniref:Uncharacterized protein n=1 Tax=Sporothrix bragantina TaxID=671064 RepID=A0ABP0CTZ2_9PEZI
MAWRGDPGADMATAKMEKLRPIFRAGGITYYTFFRGFELQRPPAFWMIVDTPRVKEALRLQ